MKVARFTQTFHEVGDQGFSRPKFEAGKQYPLTDETRRCVARGIAEEVEVPDEPSTVEVKTLKLKKA